jgi:hypothetical protein
MNDRMPEPAADPHVERFARRAVTNPAFLGWQLAAFARARRFDDAALAAYLECAPAALANVRTCGPIRAAHRRADVAEVAAAFGLNPARLAEATKEVPAEVRAADAEPDPAPGVAFLAARDRTDQS